MGVASIDVNRLTLPDQRLIWEYEGATYRNKLIPNEEM
jgi:hypothetical protein